MMIQLYTKQLLTLLTLVGLVQILVACRGEGDSEVAATEAGITTSDVINGSGSMTVNGIRFHADNLINGSTGPDADFAIGLVGGKQSVTTSHAESKDMVNGNALNENKGSTSHLGTTEHTLIIDTTPVNNDTGTAF